MLQTQQEQKSLSLALLLQRFWDFILAIEIQTHTIYLEKSDDLTIVEFVLLDFFFLFDLSLERCKLSD